MPKLDLTYVDELIAVRQMVHGGAPGAPPMIGTVRQGSSINRSIIVMISALMQTYVEDVFKRSAKRAFPALNKNPAAFEKYWNQMSRWGNPSDDNINRLFLQIGVPDIFDGLSWQGTTTPAIKKRLNRMNQVRNKIAHGAVHLTVDGQPYSLSFAEAVRFRDFANTFGTRFGGHAITKVRRSKLGLT